MDDERYQKFVSAWGIAEAANTNITLTHLEMDELLTAINRLRAENAALRARLRQLEIEQELDIREIGRLALENEELSDLHGQQLHPPDDDEPVAGLA